MGSGQRDYESIGESLEASGRSSWARRKIIQFIRFFYQLHNRGRHSNMLSTCLNFHGQKMGVVEIPNAILGNAYEDVSHFV